MERRGRYIAITNDNRTEAVLFHSYMPRQADVFIPTPRRLISSYIRLGNVIVILREERQSYNLHDDISSRFIELLVDLLNEY
jgi:hypothetical protein